MTCCNLTKKASSLSKDFAGVNLFSPNLTYGNFAEISQTRMWANAQRDGRPAKCRWHPLFNATNFR